MTKISENRFNEMVNNIWSEYLSQASTEDLHQTVLTKNYGDVYIGGNGEWIMLWIVDNPNTEKATALLLYWKLGARGIIDKYPLIDKLEENLINNFYKSQLLGFNPKNDTEGYNWTSDYRNNPIQRDIPIELEHSIEGQNVYRSSDFEDGLPIEYYEKIDALFDEYEISDED